MPEIRRGAHKTRLTASGNPTLGTYIEIHLDPIDGQSARWEECQVVGKGNGRVGGPLLSVCVEWGDGQRQWVHDFGNLVWRPLGKVAADA